VRPTVAYSGWGGCARQAGAHAVPLVHAAEVADVALLPLDDAAIGQSPTLRSTTRTGPEAAFVRAAGLPAHGQEQVR
jgi:hypothetical protein